MSIQARRHSPRVKLNETACINFGSGNHGVILDVSEGGLRFQSDSSPQAAGPLSFWLANNHRSETAAELAWSDESGEISGLRFTNLPPEMYKQIRAWMDQAQYIPKVAWHSPPIDAESAQLALMTPQHESVEEPTSERTSDYVVAPELLSSTATPSAAEAKSERSNPREALGVASNPIMREMETNFSMFPTGGYNHLAIAMSVVLFLLVAATGAAMYFYPNQVHDAMNRVHAKIIQFINPEHQQPISSVDPAAMGAAPASNPGFEGTLESAPSTSNVVGATGELSIVSEPVISPTPLTSAQKNSSIKAVADDDHTALTRNRNKSDLVLAQSYLGPSSTPDQRAKAVQLLWLATEKNNIDAEIRLAGLYTRGVAVPKSCVQARILLKAAAAMNSSVAKSKLADLDDAGCN